MRRLLSVFMAVILVISFTQLPVSAASLKLNRSSVDIPVDYYTTLKVKGAKGTVKWSSENSKIASVEPVDGKSADIIGKKTGTATIFAKVDGTTLKCRVNVKKSLISVSSDHAELSKGESKTISVSVLGSKKLSVRSSNKNVCSVSWDKWDGNNINIRIKAKKDGAAELDLYTKDYFKSTAVPVDIIVDSSGTLLMDAAPDAAEGEPDEWKDIMPLSERKKKSENADYKKYCAEMQQIIAGYDHSCEVLLYSPEYGELFSHNTKEYVPGASTIKLAYAYYCCTQIEQGRHSLSETLKYEQKHYYGSSGKIQFYDFGTEWNVATLLDYTLRYSDNVAYFMLLDIFGEDGFNEMLRSWGYGSIQLGDRKYPDSNAEFLKTSMLKMQEKSSDSRQCWKLAWNALLQSEKIEIRKEISGVDMAVKFGSTYGYYHEVCYIDGDIPHVLVIMTGVEGKTRSEAFIRKAAVCAEKIVQSQKRRY
ncbi:MAG: serine hydrolase [Oscillospiraceae bacterium]|nr:serine hydrolase [Oscillospiraceae bacterium]